MAHKPKKIAVIGFGAMARSLQRSLEDGRGDLKVGAALVTSRLETTAPQAGNIKFFVELDDLITWRPDLVVECASHHAVADLVPGILEVGIDVVIASIGSLADCRLLQRLEEAAETGGSHLRLASGAVGGLDVLRSASIAGLTTVRYIGTKPPAAWKGTPAEEQFDLPGLACATEIYRGTAAKAALDFPKNANVTAAIALAGIGFNDTEVTLIADPAASSNTHRLEASGNFGSFSIILENRPLPDNPKTSWLAALSIEQSVRRHFQSVEL